MNITKLILRKIKKLKTIWKIIKEIINLKNNNDVSINSLLIGEIITTNAKLIANHFHIQFFTSVAAKLNEKIVKAKKRFHIILAGLGKLSFLVHKSLCS